VSSSGCLGRVAEWQTRWLQVPVSFGTWGFKSPFAHPERFYELTGARLRSGLHLHIGNPAQRRVGIGAGAVRQSLDLHFEAPRLKRLVRRVQCLQRGSESNPKGRIPLPQDPPDGSWTAELLPGRDSLAVREATGAAQTWCV